MPVFDHISTVRNRYLALLNADVSAGGTASMLRAANKPKANDNRDYGVKAKSQVGIASDFPFLDILYGDGDDELFALADASQVPLDFGDGDDNQEFAVMQEFVFRVIHRAMNDEVTTLEARKVVEAIRAGGRQMAIPGTPGSELAFVLSQGPATIRRTPEWIMEGARYVHRITIPVRMVLLQSEVNP